jgi:hypothetical protein
MKPCCIISTIILVIVLILLAYPNFLIVLHTDRNIQWSDNKIPFNVITKTSTNKLELITGIRDDGVFVWKKAPTKFKYK